MIARALSWFTRPDPIAKAADDLREATQLVLQEALRGDASPRPNGAFITFNTTYPGVVLSKAAAAKHPVEMQVWLEPGRNGLRVSDKGFSHAIIVNRIQERLTVPWKAITATQIVLKFATPVVCAANTRLIEAERAYEEARA